MQNKDLIESNNKDDYEIDLRKLFYIVNKGKKTIFSFVIFFSFLAIFYSLFLPNIYQSIALLTPNENEESRSSALSGFSSLAGFAGIELPSSNGEGNSAKAIEKLSSLSFFEKNLLPEIFLPELMAIESWDAKTNKLYFDDDIYDESTNTWVRDFSYPQKQIPSSQESFEVFKQKHFLITKDDESGFISLNVKHQSPFVAKKWTELIVSQINTFYREKDKTEAEKTIEYLNEQVSKNSFSEIKQALAELLQVQIQKLALIEANEAYIFDYIDPPAVMEKKIGPNRTLIWLLGAIFGLIFSTFMVMIRYFRS
ncbi:MAG: chain length determinant protein [Flavobacteriales bacterium]|nr:chain length determinant protein [Flavobacteriales bacterium]